MPFSPQTTEIRLNNLEGQKTMNKAQHTPGPWIHDKTDNTIMSASWNYAVCALTGGVTGNEANARLIASAPELLEALKSFVKWTEIHGLNHAQLINGKYAEVPVVINARKAIAKAEGK